MNTKNISGLQDVSVKFMFMFEWIFTTLVVLIFAVTALFALVLTGTTYEEIMNFYISSKTAQFLFSLIGFLSLFGLSFLILIKLVHRFLKYLYWDKYLIPYIKSLEK